MKPIQISFRQLSVFDAVARTGSVSQAALEISLSQSATSLSLRELEKSLGASLFERFGKKLVLNANGRRLHPQAHSLLQQGQDFYLDKGSEALSGVIRLAASSTIGQYLLPEICSRFLARHPAVQIDLSIASTIEVMAKTEQMTVDLGLIEGPSHQRSLASSTWLEDRLVFFVGPKHRLARKKNAISIQELKDELWFLEPLHFTTRSLALSSLVSHFPAAKIAFVSPSIESIKRAVRAGDGLGCLSQYAIQEELKRKELMELKVSEINISRVFHIVQRKEDYRSPLQQAFLAELFAENEPQPLKLTGRAR